MALGEQMQLARQKGGDHQRCQQQIGAERAFEKKVKERLS